MGLPSPCPPESEQRARHKPERFELAQPVPILGRTLNELTKLDPICWSRLDIVFILIDLTVKYFDVWINFLDSTRQSYNLGSVQNFLLVVIFKFEILQILLTK